MILIAQFSDLHFGGDKTLAEMDRCMGAAVQSAMDAGVHIAVISGDATDHALDVHSPAFVALARHVRALADHCPVLMLQGTFSHEPPGTLEIFRLLGGRWPIHVADRISQVAWTPAGWKQSPGWALEQVTGDESVIFTCVPTVNKAVVAAAVGAEAAAHAVGEQLAKLLQAYGALNALARASGIPTVGVSHGTVSGCVTEHGVPMAGLDHEFTTGALFAAQASAFMLGHIHKHQVWRDGTRLIAYPGSIGRGHYGEEGDKGYLLWEVDACGAQCRLIPTPARKMVHIRFDGAPDLAQLRQLSADARGALVRVTWEIGEEDRHTVDREAIEAVLSEAVELKLEGRIVPIQRARATGISVAGTLTDKLRRWGEVSGVTTHLLEERLATALSTEPEAIAKAVFAETVGAPVDGKGGETRVGPSLFTEVKSAPATAEAMPDLFA